MIYDCFSFFNELDLLEIRLNVLRDVVDKFVLVEARETHTGKAKPLLYEKNKNRFEAFRHKIIHITLDSFPKGHDAWWNENYQRNAILQGLAMAKSDDTILISDIDEIPNPDVVRKNVGLPGLVRFHHASFGFYLNMMDLRCRNMHGTVMLSYASLLNGFDGTSVRYDEFLPMDLNCGTTATKVRRCRFPSAKGGEHVVKNAGWHFTCLGGAKALMMKMRSVAPHHGFNPDDPKLTVEHVESLLEKGQGPALKMNCFAVPLDGSFPKYLLDHKDKYAHLIFPLSDKYIRRTKWPRLFRTIQGRMIQFCEWIIPPRLHHLLHDIRMWAIGAHKRKQYGTNYKSPR